MKRVVIEQFEDSPFDPEEVMEFVDNELGNTADIKSGPMTVAIEEPLTTGERQALKHFDALLTAAQEVVNDAALGDPDMPSVVEVDHAIMGALRSIVERISDEAVGIIEEVQREAQAQPTVENCNAVGAREGWVLSQGSDTLNLEKDDDNPRFKSDDEALEFVKGKALEGSRIHAAALAYREE